MVLSYNVCVYCHVFVCVYACTLCILVYIASRENASSQWNLFFVLLDRCMWYQPVASDQTAEVRRLG